jgi:hemerythrin
MNEIPWKDEYCIGIEEIDRQHIDFIKLINRFVIVSGSGTHIRLQDRILLEILKYVEYHCVSEENLMIISKYPGIGVQEEEHRALLKTFQYKYAGVREGTINGNDIIKYLVNWFLQHTQEADRKFAAFLTKKGDE